LKPIKNKPIKKMINEKKQEEITKSEEKSLLKWILYIFVGKEKKLKKKG
jgi:hypothetical protein